MREIFYDTQGLYQCTQVYEKYVAHSEIRIIQRQRISRWNCDSDSLYAQDNNLFMGFIFQSYRWEGFVQLLRSLAWSLRTHWKCLHPEYFCWKWRLLLKASEEGLKLLSSTVHPGNISSWSFFYIHERSKEDVNIESAAARSTEPGWSSKQSVWLHPAVEWVV